MANTQKLKKIVEPKLLESFRNEYDIEELPNISSLLGTQPDLIGRLKHNNNILVIGEVTVSGFYGHKGKNFHLGATRKLAESFLKLHILKNSISAINKELKSNYSEIRIYFIYPEDAKFMLALGYRERIFNLELNKGPVEIDEDTRRIIDEIIVQAREEITSANKFS